MKKTQSKNLIAFFGMTLAVMLVLTGCGKGCGKQGGAPGAAGVLDLIPADNNVLVGVNWKKLAGSPLGEKFTSQIPPDMAPLIQNVEGFTMGFKVTGMGQEPEELVAVISGKFDTNAILTEMKSQAEKKGVTISDEDYEGVKIYSPSEKPDMGLAFVGEKGIFGKKSAIKKSIDLTKKKGDSIQKNQDIMDLMKAIDMGKMVWAVAIVPEGAIPAGGPGGPGNPLGAFAGIKALDLALDISGDLSVDLGIIAGTPDDAKQMETMANSYKTLFGSSLAQKDPNLGKVLDSLNIAVDGNRVALSLKLDQATVDELSKKAAGGGEPMPAEMAPGGDEGSGDDMGAPPSAPDAAGDQEQS